MAISYTGTVCTTIMTGDGAIDQYMFCIENSLQSRVKVYVRRAYFFDDHVAVLTSVAPRMVAYRATNVQKSANTAIYTKAPFDTTQTSDSGVNIYSGLMPSFTGASGLSATPAAANFSGLNTRAHTIYGRSISGAINVVPAYAVKNDYVLYPGESLIVKQIASPVTADTFTDYYFFNAVWQEEPIGVHGISGTITAGGTPVVGAKVIVLVADDTSLTNAYLWAVTTSVAGGAWSVNNIPDGKLAYAYAQNYTGGTYFTAAGAPYIS